MDLLFHFFVSLDQHGGKKTPWKLLLRHNRDFLKSYFASFLFIIRTIPVLFSLLLVLIPL